MIRAGCDAAGLCRAAEVVRSGGTAVFPTDTVYGLGCDPYDAAAVESIYRIKGRDRSKPLPVLAGSAGAVRGIADLSGRGAELAARFWPGALTLVLRATDRRLAGSLGSDTVAVRVPGSRCAQELLAATGPLAGTSANVSGEAPFSDPRDFPPGLSGVGVFVDGGIVGGTESTIVDVTGAGPRVLRRGAVDAGVPG